MFKIEVEFKDWMGRREFKTESTDSWVQAFGAFTIYVSDNDCVSCQVFDDNEKRILDYTAP